VSAETAAAWGVYVSVATLVVLILTLGAIVWYTWETRQQRETSQATLDQLREEHLSRNYAHVRVLGWSQADSVNGPVANVQVSLINLGPGPAAKIQVTAYCKVDSHEVHQYRGENRGMLTGDRMQLPIEKVPEVKDFPSDLPEGSALIVVETERVDGRKMNWERRRFRYPPAKRS
jgi:hypothetical protein